MNNFKIRHFPTVGSLRSRMMCKLYLSNTEIYVDVIE